MSGFEDLNVWQISLELSVNIYKDMKDSKDWSIKDQVLRSALSISSNIAEGHDRKSAKEFKRFLNIALASCAELRSQLLFVKEVKILEATKAEEYIQITKKISAMIVKLSNSISTRKQKQDSK
jgi:four helix bundle protein